MTDLLLKHAIDGNAVEFISRFKDKMEQPYADARAEITQRVAAEIAGTEVQESELSERAQLPAVQPDMVKDLKKIGKESGLFSVKTKKLKGSSLVDVSIETKSMSDSIELNDPKKPWKKKISDVKSKFKYDASKR